jgi:hypothetical protein
MPLRFQGRRKVANQPYKITVWVDEGSTNFSVKWASIDGAMEDLRQKVIQYLGESAIVNSLTVPKRSAHLLDAEDGVYLRRRDDISHVDALLRNNLVVRYFNPGLGVVDLQYDEE